MKSRKYQIFLVRFSQAPPFCDTSRTKVAPIESHLGHILGTKNKKTPLEAFLKGFSEVPSGIEPL